MQTDKAALKSLYLTARAEKKKPYWRADRDTADYCLFYDNKKHWPNGKVTDLLPRPTADSAISNDENGI